MSSNYVENQAVVIQKSVSGGLILCMGDKQGVLKIIRQSSHMEIDIVRPKSHMELLAGFCGEALKNMIG